MNRYFRWKKSFLVFSAAFVMTAAGIAGSHPITAWAIPTSGTAADEGVRVRETAVDGALVGSLSDGQEVTILDETTGSDGMTWYQVTYEVNGSSRIGWVRSDLLNTSGEDTADTEVTEETVEETDGSYAVAETIPESVIPEGFEVTAVTYQEREVQALYSDALDLYLLYAVNADDESDAGLFIYDIQYETMYPFIQFQLAEDSVILLDVPDEEQQLVSDRFVQTEYTTAYGSITVYQIAEPDELVAEDAAITDYYYLYGINSIGETGWYLYNATEGTIQKNVMNMQYSISASTAEAEETEVGTNGDGSFGFGTLVMTRLILCVIALICLILLVIAILFSVRYRRLRRILENDGTGGNADSGSGENRLSQRDENEEEKLSDVFDQENHEERKSSDSAHRQKPGERKASESSVREKPEHPRRDLSPSADQSAAAQDRSGKETQFRDDMDVIDLDDMGDEDYETMLNKYLSENFPSEAEETDREESFGMEPDISEKNESQPGSLKETEPKAASPGFDFADLDELEPDSVGKGVPERSTSDKTDDDFDLPDFIQPGNERADEDDFDFVISQIEDSVSSQEEDTGDDKTGKSHRRRKDD